MHFLNTYLYFLSTNIALRMIFWVKKLGSPVVGNPNIIITLKSY